MNIKKMTAAAVHFLTASGAVVGVFAIQAIYAKQYQAVLVWMTAAVVIDAIDGALARASHVKTYFPKFDGALLDNIIDYLNYVVVPVCFLLQGSFLSPAIVNWMSAAILLSSGYQFCQTDAKTEDHFFKGFPSYWNIVVFYLFLFQTSMLTNFYILSACVILVFIPIKYVYPSRMDYFAKTLFWRLVMLSLSVLWGMIIVALIVTYPSENKWLLQASMVYVIIYLGASVFVTYRKKSTSVIR